MALKVNLAWNEICLKKRSLIREETLVLGKKSANCKEKIDLLMPAMPPLKEILTASS